MVNIAVHLIKNGKNQYTLFLIKFTFSGTHDFALSLENPLKFLRF